jgi:hypothetical protein
MRAGSTAAGQFALSEISGSVADGNGPRPTANELLS